MLGRLAGPGAVQAPARAAQGQMPAPARGGPRRSLRRRGGPGARSLRRREGQARARDGAEDPGAAPARGDPAFTPAREGQARAPARGGHGRPARRSRLGGELRHRRLWSLRPAQREPMTTRQQTSRVLGRGHEDAVAVVGRAPIGAPSEGLREGSARCDGLPDSDEIEPRGQPIEESALGPGSSGSAPSAGDARRRR